ncbi:hypothetical protein FACS1894126_5780 [Alphaproteobacteria bacterium]|nr:hypothetical protein FACS1894126_5780 [Alphaproteobacteria bacterium]
MRDDNHYELAKKVSNKIFKAIALEKNILHESWNYKISPQSLGQIVC